MMLGFIDLKFETEKIFNYLKKNPTRPIYCTDVACVTSCNTHTIPISNYMILNKVKFGIILNHVDCILCVDFVFFSFRKKGGPKDNCVC